MPPSTAPRSSAGGGGTKASDLCARVERLFTPAEDQKIPYTNHAHGCELLCRIRRQVANGERLHKRACRSLAFAGIDVWRSARADEALDWGLVTQVVDDDAVVATAGKIAAKLAAGPTRAFGKVKDLLAQSFSNGLETQLEEEARGIVVQSSTADGREGIAAFLEKRKPEFRGR